MADGSFYRAFEDRYRGSRELIKSRLAVYLPFIQPLQQFHKTCQGVDLGCGRGEWLELMQENGMDVQGIDLDEGMLEAARERGLKVAHGDAIESLQSLAPESQTLVSGFHLAEHLPFETLQILIRESLRVLKPGGLLILETPNPENIVVGTANFYLDPSHQHPIPSQLLTFMVEYAGFDKVKTLRLQEPAGLADSNALTLLSVFSGVSPDYAVVAQKGGALEISAASAPAFDADYGLSLEILASNYDHQIKAKAQQAEALAQQAAARAQQAEALAQQAAARAQQAEALTQQVGAKAQQAEALAQQAEAIAQQVGAKAQQTEAIAQQAEAKAQQAEAIAQQAGAKAQQAEAIAQHAVVKAQQAEVKAQQAEVKAQQAEVKAAEQEQRTVAAEARVIDILNSASWRITSPLRRVGNALKTIFLLPGSAKSTIKVKIKLLLAHAKLYINRRPGLKWVGLAILMPFPALERRLKQATMAASSAQIAKPLVVTELANLSPRAHRIYAELKTAIEDNNKESC